MLHILLHDGGAGEQDLTLFAVRELLLRARLYDFDVRIREREPDASLLEHMVGGETAGGHRLGGAVSLAHLDGGVVVG